MTEAEQEAERIARKLAREAGQEPLWELYLSEAYGILFPTEELEKPDEDN